MKVIPIVHNNIELKCLVDDEDYDYYSKWKWRLNGKGYASRSTTSAGTDGRNHTVALHRLIMKAKKVEQIDHINGNPLDNQRSNLRFCTQAQNLRNRGKNKNSISGYKGVSIYRRPAGNKWRAMIGINYKLISLGVYDTPEEAALAYNKAALKADPEFSKLNIVP